MGLPLVAPSGGLCNAQKDKDLIRRDSGLRGGGLPPAGGEASVPQAGLRRTGRVVLAAPGKAGLVEAAMGQGSCRPSPEGSAVMDLAKRPGLKC